MAVADVEGQRRAADHIVALRLGRAAAHLAGDGIGHRAEVIVHRDLPPLRGTHGHCKVVGCQRGFGPRRVAPDPPLGDQRIERAAQHVGLDRERRDQLGLADPRSVAHRRPDHGRQRLGILGCGEVAQVQLGGDAIQGIEPAPGLIDESAADQVREDRADLAFAVAPEAREQVGLAHALALANVLEHRTPQGPVGRALTRGQTPQFLLVAAQRHAEHVRRDAATDTLALELLR